MRGEEKSNYLASVDKQLIQALKEAAWERVGEQLEGLAQAALDAEPSKSDKNWNPPSEPLPLSATDAGKRLGWAVAEGYAGGSEGSWLADVPTAAGLLGDKLGRSLDLVHVQGEGLAFFAFKVNPSEEDIFKALRDLLVHSVLYRVFLRSPRTFGYNTERSPLALDEPGLSWELVAPKDMLNPRRSAMRWDDRDADAMRRLMKPLGVGSFSLSRLQAEAEALRANLAKENFSASRARLWFENREIVRIA